VARRVRFSRRHLSPEDIAGHHRDLQEALRIYYQPGHDGFDLRFRGYTAADLDRELDEVDVGSSFTLMAAVEASFRIDYLQRAYLKRKDPVSRAFRVLHKRRGAGVSLEDDILDVWKAHVNQTRLIGDLRAALGFRHWIAHGKYWEPKLGRAYNFANIYDLAKAVRTGFPLEKVAT
jgi:hypothetical protein